MIHAIADKLIYKLERLRNHILNGVIPDDFNGSKFYAAADAIKEIKKLADDDADDSIQKIIDAAQFAFDLFLIDSIKFKNKHCIDLFTLECYDGISSSTFTHELEIVFNELRASQTYEDFQYAVIRNSNGKIVYTVRSDDYYCDSDVFNSLKLGVLGNKYLDASLLAKSVARSRAFRAELHRRKYQNQIPEDL